MGFSSSNPVGTLPHKHSNATGDGGQLDETTVISFAGRVKALIKVVIGS